MAAFATPFATGSPATVKVWSQKLLYAIIQKCYFKQFSSMSGDNVIHIMNDLTRTNGDQIKFDLLAQIAGSHWGVNNGATVNSLLGGTGEQAITYNQDSILIGEKVVAQKWDRMSMQRSIHDLYEDSLRNLSDAWARIVDSYLMSQLTGRTGTGGNGGTLLTDSAAWEGANATTMSGGLDANHKVATTGSVETDDFSTAHIESARWKAETLVDAEVGSVQKLRVNGQECYVAFIRPEAAKNLRSVDADWKAAQQYAQERGDKNPLFVGSLGMWGNVILHVSSYLPFNTAGAGVQLGYNVLCGKQAAVAAFGHPFNVLDKAKYQYDGPFAMVPRDATDYGSKPGMLGGAIWGIKRTMTATATTPQAFGAVSMGSTDPVL